MFEIDKDVPIPPARYEGDPARKDNRHYLYPFEHMRVGDSFLVPFGEDSHPAVINRANNAKCRNQSATKRRYVTRVVGDGVRVWRTK